MKNVIEFKDVGLNFGGVKALDGISFEVKAGRLRYQLDEENADLFFKFYKYFF